MANVNVTPKYDKRDLTELVFYEKNAKKHPPEQIIQLADIIREVGFKVPVVIDKNNVIVSGHGRVQAAKQLGLKEIPVIVADDLTPTQVKAYRLADNKIAESGVNKSMIIDELEELKMEGFDISLTGYDEGMLETPEGEKPEEEFGLELLEEQNYVVLVFNNTIDWMSAKEALGLKTVAQSYQSKKNVADGALRKGTGRVIDGAAIIRKLTQL
jgi:hypothetical protein